MSKFNDSSSSIINFYLGKKRLLTFVLSLTDLVTDACWHRTEHHGREKVLIVQLLSLVTVAMLLVPLTRQEALRLFRAMDDLESVLWLLHSFFRTHMLTSRMWVRNSGLTLSKEVKLWQAHEMLQALSAARFLAVPEVSDTASVRSAWSDGRRNYYVVKKIIGEFQTGVAMSLHSLYLAQLFVFMTKRLYLLGYRWWQWHRTRLWYKSQMNKGLFSNIDLSAWYA